MYYQEQLKDSLAKAYRDNQGFCLVHSVVFSTADHARPASMYRAKKHLMMAKLHRIAYDSVRTVHFCICVVLGRDRFPNIKQLGNACLV